MHISFALFAGILCELAETVSQIPEDDILHRDLLTEAVAQLHYALLNEKVRQRRVAGQPTHFAMQALALLSGASILIQPVACRDARN